jgi:hypothetical protein
MTCLTAVRKAEKIISSCGFRLLRNAGAFGTDAETVDGKRQTADGRTRYSRPPVTLAAVTPVPDKNVRKQSGAGLGWPAL